jgi:hypothetical protein
MTTFSIDLINSTIIPTGYYDGLADWNLPPTLHLVLSEKIYVPWQMRQFEIRGAPVTG